MFNGLKKIIMLVLVTILTVSCSNTLKVQSYPSKAKVYVKDIITNTKQLLGETPLNIKRSEELSDVFFVSIEKDNFLTREILVKSAENESVAINAKLEPKEEQILAEQLGLDKSPLKPEGNEDDRKKKVDEQEKQIKDLETKIALLSNTLGVYKDALFSQRYISSDRFTPRENDKVVKLLFNAQQDISYQRYDTALEKVNKALEQDEYLAQGHVIKGSVYYILKDFKKARTNWERALEIDPYNAEVLKYLKKLYKKLGLPQEEAVNMAESLKKETTRAPASTNP